MIVKNILILLLLFCLFSSDAAGQDPNFHIYLAFGQSNMEGQGIIEETDKNVDSRFLVLQAMDCPDLDREKGNWYPAVPPLCQCYSGLGPLDYFGRTMVQNSADSIKIGVVNVAVGGCDIRLFDKDIYSSYVDTYEADWFQNKVSAYGGNPYRHLIELAKEAQNSGVIKGILLHQGETNTGDKQWPDYVNKIYTDLTKDLSLNPEETPLLAGEVVSVEDNCCASMNTIIKRLPKVIDNAHIISSKGCTAADQAHFDSEGYRELGRRYAVRMSLLLSKN